MVFAVVKKDGAGKHRPKQNGAKILGRYKRNKTQNMPPCEELRGDSPSGLAANAPFRSGSKVDLFIRVQRVCLAGA